MTKSIPKIAVLIVVYLTTSCASQKTLVQQTSVNPIEQYVSKDTKTTIAGNYLGSYYNGNYVWGGAMNLAWNELNENILKEKLQLKSQDKTALEMVEKLNNPSFTKNDLDENSYYIKSGFGQQTVTAINQELKAKFPTKSFGDLKINLDKTSFVSYAYFLKEVEYETKFDSKDIVFNGQLVKGFFSKNYTIQGNNLEIMQYESDEKFIISIKLKDEKDELILAKGYDMTNPETIVNQINAIDYRSIRGLGDYDEFEAPKLKLDFHRDYVELLHQYLNNKGYELYQIDKMFENIKFNMDEKGARVENEAAIAIAVGMVIGEAPIVPKKLYLNKPFWVVMKKSDSKNPYFILGINNTELMEKNN